MKKVKSGQIAPKSGTYQVIDEQGNNIGSVQMQKGNRIPPTQQAGAHFEIE